MGVNQERSVVIMLKVLDCQLKSASPLFATKIRIGRGHRRRYGRCRRTILLCSDETLQRLPNLMPKSRITVAPGPIHGKSLQ